MSTYAKIKLVINGGFMEIATISGVKTGPGKYFGRNRYLTLWEKEMRKAINSIIKSEVKMIYQTKNASEIAKVEEPGELVEISPEKVFYSDKSKISEAIFRKFKAETYEDVYRRRYTLTILKRGGLDIDLYAKTWLNLCNSSDVLLGCIQDKIDGFDYNSEGERIPNNCPMDEGKLDVEYIYEGDILRISDGDHTHEFTVDKNQLVYVDGVVAFDMRSARIKDEYYNEVREGTLAYMMSKAKH